MCFCKSMGFFVFYLLGFDSTQTSKTLPSCLLPTWYLTLFCHWSFPLIIWYILRLTFTFLLQIRFFFHQILVLVFFISLNDFLMIQLYSENWWFFFSQIVWFTNCVDSLLKPLREWRWVRIWIVFGLFGLPLVEAEFMHEKWWMILIK